MENEMLKVFDEQGNWMGTETRSEVHKAGYWHETFHCWLTERIGNKDFLFFQIRSSAKKIILNCWISLQPGTFLLMKVHWMA